MSAKLAVGANTFEASMAANLSVTNSSVGISAVGGAAGVFAAGGIQGGDIESAISGAVSGAASGGLTSGMSAAAPIARVAARTAAGAAFAYLNCGNWRRAAGFAAGVALAGEAWEYTKTQTDEKYSRACAAVSECYMDELGQNTDGVRVTTGSILDREWDALWRPVRFVLRKFVEASMEDEGSGTHAYDPGQPLCDVRERGLCFSVRDFIRQVSKPHDYMGSFNYEGDPSSAYYGYRIAGGGPQSSLGRIGFEVAMQSWSFATMPVAAAFTSFALYGQYSNPQLYRR